jgi:hypothetical protein
VESDWNFANLESTEYGVETREMRDRDKIWTIGSMEISTVDQTQYKLAKYEAPFFFFFFWHSLWSSPVVTRREGVNLEKLHFEVSGIATWRVEMPHLQIHEIRNRESTLWISVWSQPLGTSMEDGGRS